MTAIFVDHSEALHGEEAGRSVYVYRFLDVEGTVVYIGQSVDPRGRLSAHRHSDWFPLVVRFEWTECPTLGFAIDLEADQIHEYHPAGNAQCTRCNFYRREQAVV